MLMKPQPESEGEHEAHGFSGEIVSPEPFELSAGAVLGRLIAGVLGLGTGAFLGLIFALFSGLIDLC